MAVQSKSPLIALLGNPNTGKSTLFNRLTGLKQRIANYPGITVDKKSGTMPLGDGQATILDLPGSYSLSANSPDERVVIDVLLGMDNHQRPDLLVCVMDATNLKRNMFMASQVAEFGIPMIIVLNQWDVLRRSGVNIDKDKLEKRLGVPVIPMVATSGDGLFELIKHLPRVLVKKPVMNSIEWSDTVKSVTESVCLATDKYEDQLTMMEARRLIFDANSSIKSKMKTPESEIKAIVKDARAAIREEGHNPGSAEAVWHYSHIEKLLKDCITQGSEHSRRTTESIDRLLMHKFWGSLIFIGIMWVVFQSVYTWAGPLMDVIDGATGTIQDLVSGYFVETPILQSLLVDGIIAGVGGVLIFVPQIFILYLFVGILEDTGYMARAAFIMDKLFGWCGLNGKSFVPLLSSYACAIPGIMAARSLEDPKARVTTIMMVPFMSCSARLPIYLLLIGAFIEPIYGAFVAGWVLFSMHFVGLFVSLPLAWFVNKRILKLKSLPFVLEMPPYKVPNARNLFIRTWGGGRSFIVTAGTVILAFSVIIWALLYFPHDESVAEASRQEFFAERNISTAEIEILLAGEKSDLATALQNRIDGDYIEQSYMGMMGKTVQPVFDPAGYDWKITVGVLSSFPAREVIIATLGIIYNLGADVDEDSSSLRDVLAAQTWQSGPRIGQPVYTIPVILSMMAFFALCMQCGASLTVMAKELNWYYAAASFFIMTLLAWTSAVLTYQLGSAICLL